MTDSIIIGIRALVEFVVILLAYRQVFNANVVKNKVKIIAVGIPMGICYFINSYFQLNIFFTVLGLVYAVLIPILLLEGDKKKWLCLYPTLMFLTSMASMAISYCVALILNIQVVDVYYDTKLSFIVDVSFLFIIFIDYFYTKKKPSRR